MKNFSLKYYSITHAVIFILLSSGIYLTFNYCVGHYTEQLNFWAKQIIAILCSLFSVTTCIVLMNKYGFGMVHSLFGLPNLRGNYEGILTSSYHIDDDESKAYITKHIKLTICQDLNGFYVESFYYDHEASIKYSSSSYSVSDDIDRKNNSEYIITYRYKNNKNKFHDDHQKYILNDHDGICILTYNPENKTLIGKYFNDSADRPSYGQLNLILNPKK
jgi:hypothetical protein